MHLLVDGWNAIHANLRLKNILLEHSQEAAVKALSDIVSAIHDCENCRTTIVYDGKGDSIEIIRPSKIQTFSEVYTPTDMTADDFIEQYCAQHPKDCTVATADNLLDLTAGFFGANIISPSALFEWARQCSQQIRNKTFQNKKENSFKWKDTNPFTKLKAIEYPKEAKAQAKIEAKTPAPKAKKKSPKAKEKSVNFLYKKDASSLSWKNLDKGLELSENINSKGKTWADTNPFLALNIKKPKTNYKKSTKK